MTRIGIVLLASVLTLSACQTGRGTGAAVGAGAGAGIGALVDDGNPWRGALIGGAIGGLAGYAVGNEIDRHEEEVAKRAHYEDRVYERTVYPENGGRYRIRAEPRGETRVTTTVSEFDPNTGEWVVVSENEQFVR